MGAYGPLLAESHNIPAIQQNRQYSIANIMVDPLFVMPLSQMNEWLNASVNQSINHWPSKQKKLTNEDKQEKNKSMNWWMKDYIIEQMSKRANE